MLNKFFLRFVAILIALFSYSSFADPIEVTYEIGDHSQGGYSASWLHNASGCTGASTYDPELTLYMCGDKAKITGGTLSGLWNDGVLSGITGSLTIGDAAYSIIAGSLGGVFGGLGGETWFLQIDGLGKFYFEDLAMSGPNAIDAHSLILWGQNLVAYGLDCANPDSNDCTSWGVDLYGNRISVPEPATLVLVGLGLISMSLIRRRRRVNIMN